MIASYNRWSLAAGITGLGLMVTGTVLEKAHGESALSALPMLSGLVLFVIGCSLCAKAKGRHWAWGFLGIANVLGYIVLAMLEDRSARS